MKHVILTILACAALLTTGCKLVVEFDSGFPMTATAPALAEDPTATYDAYEHSQTYGDFTNAVKAGWHIESVAQGPGGQLVYLKRLRRSP